MRITFSCLPKFAVKVLELAGAGLASTAAAYLLAHMGAPSSTPLVEITAANAEMMRMVRDEHTLLVELGKGLDIQKSEQAATGLLPVLAPAKPAQVAPSRHQRTQRTMPLDAKSRAGEPPKIGATSPTILDQNLGSQLIRVSASTHTGSEGSSLGMLKRSTSPIQAWP